jgi:hypothetical protein
MQQPIYDTLEVRLYRGRGEKSPVIDAGDESPLPCMRKGTGENMPKELVFLLSFW